ncbi:hypothetical protein KEM09_19065 [Carboxylicivirga mesophila]|uniref:Uncharacterized protein n=1 Tax=Carboxylicivirga mesophila TaxID=1166478 RepID=A0ABS5KEP2_9BACT|nr:hypothetical protein [Carboxylicivirga mesophila]MBS2213519.1 hypothetical protein [Carboxylicivirga mesophila]
MKSVVNSKKQEQYKKFMAKDAAFLKKIVGGEGDLNSPVQDEGSKIKL